MAIKNYSIRRNPEYKGLESDRLKYHYQCKQFSAGFGGLYTCLKPTMSQDHAQLDSSLIRIVILPIIHADPSISILYSVIELSLQVIISKGMDDIVEGDCLDLRQLEESYNKLPILLQALQECLVGTVHNCVAVPYYKET
ncbi:hypothetical protein Ahy_B06g083258 [Arachis hypogaea]|uniref:Uncharacterized protein n=1 Tax=Arachis hypogaea TaxID=3818 RepID=A0A444YPN3_ARAHY|nr:hypothetical protein Ahy_B06g083258 [Arachis hypogaea]